MHGYRSSERLVRAKSNHGQSYKHKHWDDCRSKVGRVCFCSVHWASVRLGWLSGSWGDSRPPPSIGCFVWFHVCLFQCSWISFSWFAFSLGCLPGILGGGRLSPQLPLIRPNRTDARWTVQKRTRPTFEQKWRNEFEEYLAWRKMWRICVWIHMLLKQLKNKMLKKHYVLMNCFWEMLN